MFWCPAGNRCCCHAAFCRTIIFAVPIKFLTHVFFAGVFTVQVLCGYNRCCRHATLFSTKVSVFFITNIHKFFIWGEPYWFLCPSDIKVLPWPFLVLRKLYSSHLFPLGVSLCHIQLRCCRHAALYNTKILSNILPHVDSLNHLFFMEVVFVPY
jgi:hypothetical protein